MDKVIFKKHFKVYESNYNLVDSMTAETIRDWWDNVKHIEDAVFPLAMAYLMEKNKRPFGFMVVRGLIKEWRRDNQFREELELMKKGLPANTDVKVKVTKFRQFVEKIHQQFKDGKMTGLEAIENAREMCQTLKLEKQVPVDHPGTNGKKHEYEAHALFREWVLDAWERNPN